ncbi:MAG: transketolase family protein [Thermoanaerobaculia bacterium]
MSYETVLRDLALADERIVVLTAENRAAIRGLPAVLGPRFLDVGIAEQTLIGASAGLALRGRIPVAHALAAFLTLRPFEFIRTDVGIPSLPVKLVGYVPGFLSEANGPTHQALEDVALMRAVPSMKVFAPADEEDLALALPAILADPAPAYVRFSSRPAAVGHTEFEIGRAEIVREGEDAALLTYGPLLREAIEAAEILAAEGTHVRVVNLRTLKPVDEPALLEAAGLPLLVTLEDHFASGGLRTVVAETLLGAGCTARLLPIDLGERWFKPALFADVLAREGFTGPAIAARIRTALDSPAPGGSR